MGRKGIIIAHSTGKAHSEAMMLWWEFEARAASGNLVSVQLDNMGTQVICHNRAYVKALMEAILFCAQQGIAARGHNESEDSLNPGNFKALMNLLSRHSEEVRTRFQKHSKSASE